MRWGFAAAIVFALTGCSKLRPGSDVNPAGLLDSGGVHSDAMSGADAIARPDGSDPLDSEPIDRGSLDAELLDADQLDADQPDASPGDAEPPDDGVFDGGDAGVLCVPEWGSPCMQSGVCGAVFDCFGSCVGGTPAPPCSCDMLFCQQDNTWSGCSDPSDLGLSCNTSNACFGSIDCQGACSGGVPYPLCQCGIPTCDQGCVGGTCDTYSYCSSGQCLCAVNDCMVAGTYCWMNAIQTCEVDFYGCGTFTTAIGCQFGCVDYDLVCGCSPDLGAYCSASTCFCNCGDFDLPGEVQCDGSCQALGGCGAVCRGECGP